MNFSKYLLIILSLILLLYLAYPEASSISEIPPLPNSLKSIEPGDTYQAPNIAAYYTDFYRDDVVDFYYNWFKSQTPFSFPLLRLNYPPEYAYTAIKDQTRSTYLEELVYPLRGSLFINGFEPHYEDGTPKYIGATDIIVDGIKFNTKTTLRYYPASIYSKIVVWLGINLSLFGLYFFGRKVFSKPKH